MADFRIWARVERMGPHRYAAMVSALPSRPGHGPRMADVRRHFASSRFVAELLLGSMSQSLRDIISARGDRVSGSA